MTSLIIRLTLFGWSLVLFTWTFGFAFILIAYGFKKAIEFCCDMTKFWLFDEDEL